MRIHGELPTVGIISEDPVTGITEVAEPVGVVAGLTPVTNPTSTAIFKSLLALKTRNPIIFAFHPNAQKCSSEAARIVYEAALKAGAPENCIQWIEHPSMDATNALMNHPGVSTILATGGNAMVKAAYSCGKPALGVGAGNAPAYIETTADIKQAVNDIAMSKAFDNGMICASEQTVIVDDNIYEDVKAEKTGHVETVKVEYDESIRSLSQILDDYYKIIDPTSLNKQGEDEGISYRTGIYYTNENDLEIIQNKTNEIQKNYQGKVVVEIQPLDNFYKAEEYHQKYLEKNPQGYCHIGKCFFG